MGMLVVLMFVAAAIGVGAFFVLAVRNDDRRAEPRSHRWLVVVPLIVMAGWILEQLLMG